MEESEEIFYQGRDFMSMIGMGVTDTKGGWIASLVTSEIAFDLGLQGGVCRLRPITMLS